MHTIMIWLVMPLSPLCKKVNDLGSFANTHKGNLSCHVYKWNGLAYYASETETSYFENSFPRKHTFICLSHVRISFYFI